MADFWGVLAVLGFFASALVHALTIGHVIVPSSVLLGLFIAIFPIFIVAILMHPARQAHLGGAEVSVSDALKGLPIWVHVVVWGSLAYFLVLWIPVLPAHKISLLGALDFPKRMIVSWGPCPFFAAAFAMRWSARKHSLLGP